jgi:hypothetical protein
MIDKAKNHGRSEMLDSLDISIATLSEKPIIG